MGKLLVNLFLLASFIGAALGDLCTKCSCINDVLDCSSLTLEHHFSNDEWNETTKTIVSFDNNNIIHLKPFPKLPITKLSFTHNHIIKIDPACFKELENITELDLSHNDLTSDQFMPSIFQGHYAPDAYEPLRNLKVLKLSANALHTLDADIFEHLPQLEHLSLNSNPLRKIDYQTAAALTSITYLRFLDLSSTSLSDLPEHLLHTPKFLDTLNLSSNLFTSLPQDLEDSHNLKKLYLDENPISSIMSFPKLPFLEVLSISWMPELTEIGPNALSGLINLQEFYCFHNALLEKINGSAFSQPAVGAGTENGQTWPPLKKVALNNNNLGFLDFELIDRWEDLEMLNIQNNPWVCECHNQWLVSTLVPLLEKKNSSNHMVDGIVCHLPEPMRGQSIVELDHRSYHMRCLDKYGNHPENDAVLLVGILIGIIAAIPLTIFVFLAYRRHLNTSAAQYHRAFYKRGDSLHEFVASPSP